MKARFYVPGAYSSDQEVLIEGEEHHHLRNVLRLKVGDDVELFDGKGRGFWGKILEVDKSRARVLVTADNPFEMESPLNLVLWVALLKREKLEWVIQKATELGVREIQPVATLRSDLKLTPAAAEKRLERWQRVALEACKQSGRTRIPAVRPPLPLEGGLARGWKGLALYLDPADSSHLAPPRSLPPNLVEELAGARELVLAIGPEGGWATPEKVRLRESGFRPMGLGPRVLRGETAAIAAVVLVQYLSGDLSGSYSGPR